MKRRALILVVLLGIAAGACGEQPQTVDSAAPGRPPVSLPAAANPPGFDSQRVLPNPPAPPVITPEQAAAAEQVVDNARPDERVGVVLKLSDGTAFVTPAPAAIKAHLNASEARRAALSPGDASPSMKAKTPKAEFGLYSDQSGEIQADNSVERSDVNVPVWVVTWTDEMVRANGAPTVGEPVPVGPAITVKPGGEPAAVNVPPLVSATVRYIIDDQTRKPLLSITEAG